MKASEALQRMTGESDVRSRKQELGISMREFVLEFWLLVGDFNSFTILSGVARFPLLNFCQYA